MCACKWMSPDSHTHTQKRHSRRSSRGGRMRCCSQQRSHHRSTGSSRCRTCQDDTDTDTQGADTLGGRQVTGWGRGRRRRRRGANDNADLTGAATAAVQLRDIKRQMNVRRSTAAATAATAEATTTTATAMTTR